MPYLLAYIESFYWIAFPIFLAVWWALAWNGSGNHRSTGPVYARQTRTFWRREDWR